MLLYLVPAKIDGTWETPQGALTLKQSAQTVTGTLAPMPIENGRLRGDQFTFSVRGAQHAVRVKGSSMTGQPLGETRRANELWQTCETVTLVRPPS